MDILTNEEIEAIILSSSNDNNWYKESQFKSNFAKGLLAAILLVLSGYSVSEASQKASVNPEDVKHAIEDRSIMENIKSKYSIPSIIPSSKTTDTSNMLDLPSAINQNKSNLSTPVAPTTHPKQVINTKEPTDSEMYEFLKQDEGVRLQAYRDHRGNLSIGIGCLLLRPQVARLMRQMGLNYKNVIKGKQSITEYQAKILFAHDLEEARESAKNCISNYNEQPHGIKMVLINMAYNVGPRGILKFTDFRKHLEEKNYHDALRAMENSKWFNQVPNRVKRLQDIVYQSTKGYNPDITITKSPTA